MPAPLPFRNSGTEDGVPLSRVLHASLGYTCTSPFRGHSKQTVDLQCRRSPSSPSLTLSSFVIKTCLTPPATRKKNWGGEQEKKNKAHQPRFPPQRRHLSGPGQVARRPLRLSPPSEQPPPPTDASTRTHASQTGACVYPVHTHTDIVHAYTRTQARMNRYTRVRIEEEGCLRVFSDSRLPLFLTRRRRRQRSARVSGQESCCTSSPFFFYMAIQIPILFSFHWRYGSTILENTGTEQQERRRGADSLS